jgi:hypothetical protein
MDSVHRSCYDIWLAFCKQRGPDAPIHWMLLMGHPGADRCTRFHSTGSPGNYDVQINRGRRKAQ